MKLFSIFQFIYLTSSGLICSATPTHLTLPTISTTLSRTSVSNESQPTMFKLYTFCHDTITQLDSTHVEGLSENAFKASQELKTIIKRTLFNLLEDCAMIYNHTMSHEFNLNPTKFSKSIQPLIDILVQSTRSYSYFHQVYTDPAYLPVSLLEWKSKIHLWKLFIKSIYSQSVQMVPVELCIWFHSLKNHPVDMNKMLLSHADSMLHPAFKSQSNDIVHTAFKSQSNDILHSLSSLYTSINTALEVIPGSTLISLIVEAKMDAFTKEYLNGEISIERMIKTKSIRKETVDSMLIRLITLMRNMLEMMEQ